MPLFSRAFPPPPRAAQERLGAEVRAQREKARVSVPAALRAQLAAKTERLLAPVEPARAIDEDGDEDEGGDGGGAGAGAGSARKGAKGGRGKGKGSRRLTIDSGGGVGGRPKSTGVDIATKIAMLAEEAADTLADARKLAPSLEKSARDVEGTLKAIGGGKKRARDGH